MNKLNLSNKAKTIFNKFKSIKLSAKLFFAIFILIIIISIVLSPEKYISVALKGILIWSTQILPALFPFIVFTKLLVSTGYVKDASKVFSPISKKLYNCPGISSYVFLMSILSGYPLGAKLTADLYCGNFITRSQAHRIVSFTSNSGPMFIVGTVGVGMLISNSAGYIILISHIFGAVLNGFLYRKYKPKEVEIPRTIVTDEKSQDFLSETMMSGINSCLLIGGYITIFFIISEVLLDVGLFQPIVLILRNFGIDQDLTNGIIFGLFEMTNGCILVASSTASLALKTSLCAFLISFGGLAISFQAFAFLNKFKISKKFYFLQKTTHAFISFVICIILSFCLL